MGGFEKGVPLEGPENPGVVTMPGQQGQPGEGETPINVTLPPAPEPKAPEGETGPAEPTYEFKSRGHTRQVTMAELQKLASAGEDYTHKTQELAAEREELEPTRKLQGYLSENPQVAQTIYQTIEQQMAQGGAQPGQPYTDPAMQNQLRGQQERLADLEYQNEVMRFQQQYPDSNSDEVLRFAIDNEIPNLVMAYRAMHYEDAKKEATEGLVQTVQAKQQASVEQHGSAAPPSNVIDTRGKSTRQLYEEGAKFYPLET